MSFLDIQNINLFYGTLQALFDVNLDINESELVTLVGPSGCGKSTLLRVVAGLLEPRDGQVRVEGSNLLKVPPEKRRIGWVPQSYALFEHLNVAANVAFGLKRERLTRHDLNKRVGEMLALCRISELADSSVGALSGGQRQRVALARALAIRPRLLLLDEPLAALDPQLRTELRAGLRQLIKDSGVTTLFVTHDQTEALSLADRVALLRAGKLEQVSTPEQLWSQPASEFAACFFGSATVVKTKRIDGYTLELLPGLRVKYEGNVEPQVALRPRDLRPSTTGAEVSVISSEYFGDTYEAEAKAQDVKLGFLTSRRLEPGERVRVNVCEGYIPTVVGRD